MAYCLKCGKEIEDGNQYCDEHSESSFNSQQLMPNVSFVAGEKQENTEFNVTKEGTVGAQFGNQPTGMQNNVTMPKKNPPLWLFPIFAGGAFILSAIIIAIFSLINTGLMNVIDFIDSDYLIYTNSSFSNILSVVIFVVASFAGVIIYNKMCRKNGLEASVFPIWYAALGVLVNEVAGVVGNIIQCFVYLICGIVSANTYGLYLYDVVSVLSVVISVINFILTVGGTFLLFMIVHKKQIQKSGK